ncbi:gamma-aminobutyric acid receptor subunit gamma-2 [Plakobranchus ocellatus]|uniref:Gamma-aminobutyric acid receptor subunit gamma-2 n=1 Tax=Plakobranchus ocellatus TaxID=259542 RepID=A0AAV4ALG5_9GAST|nr:gamma-aminobutyric acid receptor subunit gamma-2 [Plakobranchus ocellatus]
MDELAEEVNLRALVEKRKRTVYIKAVFLKIEDINTIQEFFSGLVFVKAKWREPALDHCINKDISTIKWDGMWGPKLDINNILGEAKQQIWRDIQFNNRGEAFALEKRRVKGSFTERMELQEFPFDIQDLSLLITSDHKDDEIQLEEDEEDISNVVTHSFVDESEWDLKNFVQCEPRDRYILGSMIFLFFVAIWHGIITRFSEDDSDKLDLYAYIVFIVVYVLLHALFFVTMIIRGYKRRAEVQQRETDYLKRLENFSQDGDKDGTKKRWRLRPGPTSKVGMKV